MPGCDIWFAVIGCDVGCGVNGCDVWCGVTVRDVRCGGGNKIVETYRYNGVLVPHFGLPIASKSLI